MNNIYGYNHFNIWQECKRKYYFQYVEKFSFPSNTSSSELGKYIHALINYYLKGYDINIFLNNASSEVLDCWNNVKKLHVLQNIVVATEWSFNSRISNSNKWLSGRIDAIFYDEKNNKYFIADWKTGKRLPDIDDFQYKVYLYSLFKAQKELDIPLSYNNLSFKYVKVSGNCETVEYSYSEQNEKMLESSILEIIFEIENSKEYPQKPDCSSPNCPYRYLCFSRK